MFGLRQNPGQTTVPEAQEAAGRMPAHGWIIHIHRWDRQFRIDGTQYHAWQRRIAKPFLHLVRAHRQYISSVISLLAKMPDCMRGTAGAKSRMHHDIQVIILRGKNVLNIVHKKNSVAAHQVQRKLGNQCNSLGRLLHAPAARPEQAGFHSMPHQNDLLAAKDFKG